MNVVLYNDWSNNMNAYEQKENPTIEEKARAETLAHFLKVAGAVVVAEGDEFGIADVFVGQDGNPRIVLVV